MDLDGPTLGKVLEACTISKMGLKWLNIIDKITFFRLLNRYWVLAAVAATLAFLCIPVPYRSSRDCILEPSARRFVSSPIEGRLTSITVRPGQEVSEGQLLASIDDQPIRRELLIAEAELQSANKRRDVALATKASGDLRLAQLECQQIQLKMDSIREQLGRLEIRSPSNGILVQGDWFGNEGMPVTLGQSLFEIAPLDRMTAEIHLTAEDLPWVKTGSQAVLRTDATGTQSWPSTLARIEPRAEIIDDKAVYIAEMDVENSSKLFRPGMKGKTVVDIGNHTIGWLLLSKPYRWLVNMWVW
jgi:multidrug resistance efflux pump